MRRHVQLIGVAAALLVACDRSKRVAAADPCVPLPLLGDDTLDLAEAALLDGGATRVSLDARGCRVYRLAFDDGGVRRLQEETARGSVLYVRELSAGLTRDLFDADGDGVFERELYEARDEAGWLGSGTITRDDAGVRRVRSERVSTAMKRTVREAWADGGWAVVSDTQESRHPQLVPITP